MSYKMIFPDGHDPTLDEDKEIVLAGFTDKLLKGKTVIFKGVTEDDIREIREILTEEIKRQNAKN